MNALGWILVAIAAWLVLSAVAGVLVGRSFRVREQQVPRPPQRTAEEEEAAFQRYMHDDVRED